MNNTQVECGLKRTSCPNRKSAGSIFLTTRKDFQAHSDNCHKLSDLQIIKGLQSEREAPECRCVPAAAGEVGYSLSISML